MLEMVFERQAVRFVNARNELKEFRFGF